MFSRCRISTLAATVISGPAIGIGQPHYLPGPKRDVHQCGSHRLTSRRDK